LKIYTKTGDKGSTQLANGARVSKADLRIESYGNVDELNALIGLLREKLALANNTSFGQSVQTLEQIQNQLFNLGSMLAGFSKLHPDIASWTKTLENDIDSMQAALPELRNFILPGGHELGALAHLARTVCRRAERGIVRLGQSEEVDERILGFFNRLSDHLFVLARFIVLKFGGKEIKWQP
jgi:cob(I)alamin adenosyltransferase